MVFLTKYIRNWAGFRPGDFKRKSQKAGIVATNRTRLGCLTADPSHRSQARPIIAHLGHGGSVVNWLRPIDSWFMKEVLPHEPHYLRQARRWSRNTHEASDLVQEAYLKLLQTDNWSAIRDPRSYTITMIRNLVLQRVRREQIVAITNIPAPSMAQARDESPGVFETIAAREALLDLIAEVERLPPVCRRVIRLRKFEERTPREIALALGISISTVETHLARGMRHLLNWRRHRSQMPISFTEIAAADDGPDENPASRARTHDLRQS